MSKIKNKKGIVSILVPCLNEVSHIGAFLNNLLDFDFETSCLDVVIIDGMSTDGTREIIRAFSDTNKKYFSSFNVIDNPGANKARALNLGIENTIGEVVLRLDVHAFYSKNYISSLVSLLNEESYVNVGAVRHNVPARQGAIGKLSACSLSSRAGIGNSPQYLLKNSIKQSEIVHLFCVNRSLFHEIGVFDERLLRGQDRDFNMRIRDSGYKSAVTTEAYSNYYIRAELKSLIFWVYACGVTPFRVQKITKRKSVSIRHYAPLLLLTGVLFLLVFLPIWLLALIGSYYFLICTYIFIEKWKDERIWVIFMSTVMLFLLHNIYGAGSLIEILSITKNKIFGDKH